MGFVYHGGRHPYPYWNESVAYELTADEVGRIDAAARELNRLCLLAVEHVVSEALLSRVGIPPAYHQWVADSWQRREAALLGRFDLAYDGSGEPKLLEYNADTPTSLLETAVAQWYWLEESGRDGWAQFNSLHDRILARWREILPAGSFVHFLCQTESREDVGHVRYLLDTLIQAGYSGTVIDLSDVGLEHGKTHFIDPAGRPIAYAFKLYPWEWMFADRFASRLPTLRTRFVEPAWKSVLAKGILPVLWELFPGHPNLLPAYSSANPFGDAPYVIKPVHSREGANLAIIGLGERCSTDGPYRGAWIYQAYTPLFSSEGKHAVIGAWMVGDTPAGLSIREDATLITGQRSQFVPHLFR